MQNALKPAMYSASDRNRYEKQTNRKEKKTRLTRIASYYSELCHVVSHIKARPKRNVPGYVTIKYVTTATSLIDYKSHARS